MCLAGWMHDDDHANSHTFISAPCIAQVGTQQAAATSPAAVERGTRGNPLAGGHRRRAVEGGIGRRQWQRAAAMAAATVYSEGSSQNFQKAAPRIRTSLRKTWHFVPKLLLRSSGFGLPRLCGPEPSGGATTIAVRNRHEVTEVR